MRPSIKAFLLSFLIFPGIGHFALGLYRRGLFFLLPSLASMYILIGTVLEQAEALTGQIMQGATPQYTETASLQYATWIFIICWFAGIIDATRLGRLADKSAAK